MITSNIKKVQKDTLFMTKELEKANKFALNDAVKQARTAGRKAITIIYNIKSGDVRKAESIKKATKTRLEAILQYESQRRSLLAFGARQLKKAGVKVKVLKAAGFKVIPHAFIQKALAGGGRAVLLRKIVNGMRVGRYPTTGRKGPSQSEMANNKEVTKKINKTASEAFDRRQEHHIDRINKRTQRSK